MCLYKQFIFIDNFTAKTTMHDKHKKHNNFMEPGAIHIGLTYRQNHNEKEILKHITQTEHINI